MDVEGARALARRIEEQEARDALLTRARPSAAVVSAETQPPTYRVSATAHVSAARRNIRMYSRDVQEVTIEGRPATVTTVRCQELADGKWRSRIVDVKVESSLSSA